MLTDAAGRGRRHVIVRQNHCSELNLQVLYFLYDDVNVGYILFFEAKVASSHTIPFNQSQILMYILLPYKQENTLVVFYQPYIIYM